MSRANQRTLPLLSLQEQFDYIPDTGIILRKSTNKPTGWQHPSGYCYVSFSEGGNKTRNLLLHRVAYALYYGIDPHPLEIDHINRVKSDNSIINLRVVTCKEQAQNRVQTAADKIDNGLYQLRLLDHAGDLLQHNLPREDYIGKGAFQLALL